MTSKKERANQGAELAAAPRKCIGVVIADDHPLVRSGLRSVLATEPDLNLLGEATNGEEVQRLCRQHHPDVLVLDLRMPGSSALDTVTYLHEHDPQTKVLILTAYDDDVRVHGLVEAGVSGYLLKEEAPQIVAQAIRAVVQGGTWFSHKVAEKLARPVECISLTRREREVLRLLSYGDTNRKIAEELCVAEITVRFHLHNIYVKINVNTRSQAVRWAMEHNLG